MLAQFWTHPRKLALLLILAVATLQSAPVALAAVTADDSKRKAVYSAATFPELTQAAKDAFLSGDGSSYVVMIPVTFQLQ